MSEVNFIPEIIIETTALGPSGESVKYNADAQHVVFVLDDGSRIRASITPLGVELRNLDDKVKIEVATANQIYVK